MEVFCMLSFFAAYIPQKVTRTFVKFIHLSTLPAQGVSSPHHGGFTFSSWNGGSWDLVGLAPGWSCDAAPWWKLSHVSCAWGLGCDREGIVAIESQWGKTKTSFFCCFFLLFFLVFFLFYYWMRTPGFWTGVISVFGKQRWDICIYISI